MPFFGSNPGGGAAGQARNTRANFPPNPASTGQDQAGPVPAYRVPGRPPAPAPIGRGFASNGTGAGNVTGGGYVGSMGGAGANYGGNIPMNQMAQPVPAVAPASSPSAAPPVAETAVDPTAGADRAGYGWRQMRRQALNAGTIDRPESRRQYNRMFPDEAAAAPKGGMPGSPVA